LARGAVAAATPGVVSLVRPRAAQEKLLFTSQHGQSGITRVCWAHNVLLSGGGDGNVVLWRMDPELSSSAQWTTRDESGAQRMPQGAAEGMCTVSVSMFLLYVLNICMCLYYMHASSARFAQTSVKGHTTCSFLSHAPAMMHQRCAHQQALSVDTDVRGRRSITGLYCGHPGMGTDTTAYIGHNRSELAVHDLASDKTLHKMLFNADQARESDVAPCRLSACVRENRFNLLQCCRLPSDFHCMSLMRHPACTWSPTNVVVLCLCSAVARSHGQKSLALEALLALHSLRLS
jgi:hypothetical protein